MNSFQSIESGVGLLRKNYNEDTPIANALHKRVQKLKEKTIEPTKEELEQSEDE